MGHPVSVVFHEAHHAQVSPIVHCWYGGETLIRDLRQVVRGSRTFGAAEMCLDLALRWCLEYGKHTVALYNVDPPGIGDGMTGAEICQLSLAFVRKKVESDSKWVLVEIAELCAISKHGVWQLDEPANS